MVTVSKRAGYWTTKVCLVIWMVLLAGKSAWADDTSIIPRIGVRQEYNDNIFFIPDNVISDHITTLSPGLELVNRTERLDLKAAGNLHGIRYADNDELNDVDYDVSGDVGYALSPLAGIAANAGYTRDSRPDRDVETTGIALGNDVRRQTFLAASGHYQWSELTRTSVSYSYQSDDWENPALNDSLAHRLELGIDQDLGEYWGRTTGLLRAGYSQYHYTSLQSSVGTAARIDIQRDTDIDYYTFTAGLRKEISELTSAAFNLGTSYNTTVETAAGAFTVFSPPASTAYPVAGSETSGWNTIGSFALTYRDESTEAALSGSHDIGGPSASTSATTRTSLDLDIRHRFSYELTGFLGSGYILNKVDRTSILVADVDEETWYLSPRAHYKFTKELYIEAYYRYSFRQNHISGNDATQNKVYFGLGAVVDLLD